MQRDEILGFLKRIDRHLHAKLQPILAGYRFELNIIGKSALILAGLTDSIGTVDIDSLAIGGHPPSERDIQVSESILSEFGRANLAVNGYYLEFVSEGIVFLPTKPEWVHLLERYKALSVRYLAPPAVVASKCFSAFSQPVRKRDRQDIVATLDQGLADLPRVAKLADSIFDSYSMDSRSDRFPAVYEFIMTELAGRYGNVELKFSPEE
jgi:hypothetical protein